MATRHTIEVQGGRIHYEVRGSGPLLLIMGAPMDAEAFAPLAEALASAFTVVTHDPRGISGSTLDDPEQESTPELRADDVATLLDALDAESADVSGSSGGAITGLALMTRYPDQVRTLVAHEPPVLEFLPDVEAQREATEDIIATFHRDGQAAAWGKFMSNAGFGGDDDDGPQAPPFEPSEQDIANGARFFAYELRNTTRFVPDIDALKAAPGRVLVGVGAESNTLVTYRTSIALAERLGIEPVEFPGDHGGFMGYPQEFADVLKTVLIADVPEVGLSARTATR